MHFTAIIFYTYDLVIPRNGNLIKIQLKLLKEKKKSLLGKPSQANK